jgi:hypothetical protein
MPIKKRLKVLGALGVALLGIGLIARFSLLGRTAIRHAMLQECRDKFAAARTAADSDRAARWFPPTQELVGGHQVLHLSCRAVLLDSLRYVQ